MLIAMAVLPVLAAEAYFVWSYGEPARGAITPVLALITGASRLLIGLAWPAVAILAASGTGRRTGPAVEGDRSTSWPLILAALYTFSIYVKGFLSVLDSAVLLAIIAVSIWAVWTGRRRPGARPTEWVLASRSGASFATRLVALTQLGYISLGLGGLPLLLMLRGLLTGEGLTEGVALELGEHERVELLLLSAQALLAGTLMSDRSAPLRGAVVLLSLFMLQLALDLMLAGGPSDSLLTVVAAVYIVAAIVAYRGSRQLSLTVGTDAVGVSPPIGLASTSRLPSAVIEPEPLVVESAGGYLYHRRRRPAPY